MLSKRGHSNSHPNNDMGAMIAVSFASGASAKKTTVAASLRSIYMASPQIVRAQAIMSR